MTVGGQENKTFTSLCWMNTKKTTSPYSYSTPKNKQKYQEKSWQLDRRIAHKDTIYEH